MISSRSIDAILHSLADAIAWCTPRADLACPDTSLRSEELCPVPDTSPSVNNEHDRSAVPRVQHALIGSGIEIVDIVTDLRRTKVGDIAPLASMIPGRSLAYAPDDDESSGGAQVGSEGYFDVSAVPPWDTWVSFVHDADRRLLIAWVPPVFIPLANQGMDHNAMDSLWWLDERENALADALRSRGLL